MGIFLLLFVAFRSVRDAFLIMLNFPLALIGGVIGVFMSGGVLSVASIIGFITLFGIATRNEVYGCAGGLADLQGTLAQYMPADAKLIAYKPKTLSKRPR